MLEGQAGGCVLVVGRLGVVGLDFEGVAVDLKRREER